MTVSRLSDRGKAWLRLGALSLLAASAASAQLWSDPRYYRCNSAIGLEQIWGAYEVPLIGDDPPRSAAWGFCDRDYPRAEIVSPYGFETAKEHYAALLAETRAKGGPTVYTQATLPDWSGRYRRCCATTKASRSFGP